MAHQVCPPLLSAPTHVRAQVNRYRRRLLYQSTAAQASLRRGCLRAVATVWASFTYMSGTVPAWRRRSHFGVASTALLHSSSFTTSLAAQFVAFVSAARPAMVTRDTRSRDRSAPADGRGARHYERTPQFAVVGDVSLLI